MIQLTCIKGPSTKIYISKGQVMPYDGRHDCILTMTRGRILDIKKLNGGYLRPLTWYHLFVDWNSPDITFIITTDVKWKSLLIGNNFRRLGSLHTTTKRTIRKFHQCEDTITITWKTALKNKDIKTKGFIDRRLDAVWAKSDRV